MGREDNAKSLIKTVERKTRKLYNTVKSKNPINLRYFKEFAESVTVKI